MLPLDAPFILLDDAREGGDPARLYADPVEILTAHDAAGLEVLLAALSDAPRRGLHAAGYFTYEAGLALEPRLAALLPADRALPLAWFGLFRDCRRIAPDAVADLLPPPVATLPRFAPDIDQPAYQAAFDQVLDYIRAGDIYQANLTFNASAPFDGDPRALYAALRPRAAAGHGGILHDGAHWLLSFSPELFFTREGARITTRPMKGTARRSADGQADAAAIAALAHDPKQRAENLMIVDLLRNDLSRIAAAGSVAVPDLFRVETYPTVHQMTSTVTARLQDGLDAADIVRALYPCGSITGAPKIRAMEIIAALERRARGIYCGAIGRIDADGDAAFNVAIRSFCLSDGEKRVSFGLGSGVVADSRAGAEWAECLAKGEFAGMYDGAEAGEGGGHGLATDGGMTGGGTAGFDLIETMAFDPAEGIARLEMHLERMKDSAAALGFAFDRHGARNALQAASFHIDVPSRIRLLLAASGAIAIEIAPMPAPLAQPVPLAVAVQRLSPDDARLCHKTSDRAHYDAPRRAVPGAGEIVFTDAQGFVTEGSFTNIFVEGPDGLLYTPPLARGLLPGVLRCQLIEEGRAAEKDLRIADLANGCLIGNSLRGLMPARLIAEEQ